MGVKHKITKSAHIELTIEDALEEYIEEKKALNRSTATIQNIEFSVKKWIKFLDYNGYDTACKSITEKYIQDFQTESLNNGMKPVSLNHYLREIRGFVYWCNERGYIGKSFKIHQVVQQQTIKETYSDDEIKALIKKPTKYATFVEWRSWAVVNWCIATGHRAATVCDIKMGDLNFGKREIMVRQTKTNKAYITPMSPALAVVIKEYIRMFRSDAEDDDYLFCNIGDEQLTVNALKHSITHYNHSRGVEKISVHAFRHTFAKNWIRNTGDTFKLQKLLGHSNLEMTRQYVNMFTEDLKEGFEEHNPLDVLKKDLSRTQKVKRNE